MNKKTTNSTGRGGNRLEVQNTPETDKDVSEMWQAFFADGVVICRAAGPIFDESGELKFTKGEQYVVEVSPDAFIGGKEQPVKEAKLKSPKERSGRRKSENKNHGDGNKNNDTDSRDTDL